MLGIPDFGIIAAYLLCILSTVACVVYGIVNWNKGGEDEGADILVQSAAADQARDLRAWRKHRLRPA